MWHKYTMEIIPPEENLIELKLAMLSKISQTQRQIPRLLSYSDAVF